MVNKLGNTASFGSELRRVETAGNQQFGAQQEALTATIQARYDSLKMSYEKPNNSTIIGGDVAKDSTVDSQENESLIFFFHPDHLGCTSYVTGADGTVAQHVEYIPYGEVFVEERSGTVGTAYLFNAKEFDDETGMYYYGARYLDPANAMWISVDPMWEKFAGMSAYNYCAGNPVKMVDPDGREWVSSDSEEGTKIWSWNDKIKSLEDAQNAGYSDFRPNGSIIDNSRIGDGKYGSVYLGYASNDVVYTSSNHDVTPWEVGVEWISGNGPRHREFKDGDNFSELLRQHDHYKSAMNDAIKAIRNGETSGRSDYGLSGIEGVGKYIVDYSTLFTAGLIGNLAVTYLGSYSLAWDATIDGEYANINVTIKNSSTMQSASRPPVIGYTDWWKNSVGKTINDAFSSGWGSKTTQTFNLTERVKY